MRNFGFLEMVEFYVKGIISLEKDLLRVFSVRRSVERNRKKFLRKIICKFMKGK